MGAYKRDSGTLSMETNEMQYTQALGDMTKYDPFMELHAAFLTPDLDHYVSAFKTAGVPTFASTFVEPASGTKYYSLLVQVDGSLQEGAGSQLALLLLGTSSTLLAGKALHEHPVPLVVPALISLFVHSLPPQSWQISHASAYVFCELQLSGCPGEPPVTASPSVPSLQQRTPSLWLP